VQQGVGEGGRVTDQEKENFVPSSSQSQCVLIIRTCGLEWKEKRTRKDGNSSCPSSFICTKEICQDPQNVRRKKELCGARRSYSLGRTISLLPEEGGHDTKGNLSCRATPFPSMGTRTFLVFHKEKRSTRGDLRRSRKSTRSISSRNSL